MKAGWKEVARLGMSGARYPHVLVDGHGWCLRLGPSSRKDDKYFSSLLALLQGLSEHFIRRRGATSPAVRGVEALRVELRQAMAASSELASRLLKGIDMELQQILLERRGGDPMRRTLIRDNEPSQSHSLHRN